jgi:hypothetical protein
LREDKMKRVFALGSALLILGVTGVAGSAAAATGPSPGTGLVGACNMINDATMGATMAHMPDQGVDGMWRAAYVSGCTPVQHP